MIVLLIYIIKHKNQSFLAKHKKDLAKFLQIQPNPIFYSSVISDAYFNSMVQIPTRFHAGSEKMSPIP